MRRHKYRRIKPTPNCTLQGYQLSLIALTATIGLTVLSFFISQIVTVLSSYVRSILFYSIITNIVSILIFAYTWFHREEVSSIEIPGMSDKSKKLAKRLRRLFNDKQITDVLKLSNTTRYGNEMPEIEVWVDEEMSSGYIAIENIANWERADREKFEQRVSGILCGKYQRFAVVNSELTASSGVGKTKLSKDLIEIIQATAVQNGLNWETCMTASTNAFDEYSGQEILFLDDIRGDSFTVSDWLKLLDPHTISPISARYHNKMGSARVIIITNTKLPAELFYFSKGNCNEDLGQFIRRIDLLVHIHNDIFHVCPHEKRVEESTIESVGIKIRVRHSYSFQKSSAIQRDEALEKILETVMTNMNWNKKGYRCKRPNEQR